MKKEKLSTAVKNQLAFEYKKSIDLDKILGDSDLKIRVLSLIGQAFKSGIEKTEEIHGIV